MRLPDVGTPHCRSRARVLRIGGALVLAFTLAACGGGNDRPWTGEGAVPWSASGWVQLSDTEWMAENGTEGYRWVEGQGWTHWRALGSGGGDPGVVVCKDRAGNDMPVNPKTITIHNNSDEPIYPAIATSMNEVNEWLQGCLRTTEPHPTQFIYKTYVNEGQGLPPHSSVQLTLPLMSQLDPQRYITWWNGGRVILADKPDRLRNPDDQDMGAVGGVGCEGQNTPCTLSIYQSKEGIPENSYAQLSEYTFGDSIPVDGQARWFKPENVGYNISYVDHVYMPVAIGPKNNPYIGYSGSAQSLSLFRQKIDAFLNSPAGSGWPLFNLDGRKLPGGYNIFAMRSGTLSPNEDVPVKPAGGFPPVLTVLRCLQNQCTDQEKKSLHFGDAVQNMQNLWGSCVSWGSEDITPHVTQTIVCPSELKNDMGLIKQFFEQNYNDYSRNYDTDPACSKAQKKIEFNFLSALSHIYGWVQFNEGCSAATNKLAATTIPGWDHHKIQQLYINDLQYNHHQPYFHGDAQLAFNPYVKLIHEDLQMNAYAFSVDDAIGFMSELGDGLIFTVGGTQGLENPDQFNYAGGFQVTMGVPSSVANTDTALIRKYGVCAFGREAGDLQCAQDKQDVFMPEYRQIPGFRVGTVPSYPVKVRFTDMHDNVYTFEVKARFPLCNFSQNEDTCYPDKTQLFDASACKVVDKNGATHAKSNDWCGSADLHAKREARDNNSSGGQITRNYIAFAPPMDF